MEIREFAESVLFSQSLEAKLRPPVGNLTDSSPGRPVPVPSMPGRPPGLMFTAPGAKSRLPSLHELETDTVRARLLHFFANHELLATELMALALLRFPDAPKPFRLGLVQTLLDEQVHTRMYAARLRQLGSTLGEHSVNGFFWRLIADMTSPMDYVSRLSLTFEQANLDYSRLFAARFTTLGDLASANLMDMIYQDEIRHVGFGLEWFQRWKQPQVSDWDAYCSMLTLPLAPNRAKAEPFNREGRRAAGLSEEFIERLNVYSRSKGRTPRLFCFNPFAEAGIGRPDSFHPNRRQVALARDLEMLPAFLSRRDDVVLMEHIPSTDHLTRLKTAGFELPEFALLSDGRPEPGGILDERRLSGFRPWAWTPDTIALFRPMADRAALPPPDLHQWEKGFRPLYSKGTAVSLMRELSESDPEPEVLCRTEDIGETVLSMTNVRALIQAWRKRGHTRFVAKLFHGVAGANMLRLWEPELSPSQCTWMERAIGLDGGLVVEPWLDRVLDFSFQFDFQAGTLKLIGTPRMINDMRGQYSASETLPRFTAGLDPELAALLNGPRGGRLRRLHQRLKELLEPRLLKIGFQGAMGIDAFAYRDPEGRLRLKPVVEINPRYTMGRLMLELRRHVANGSSARLELVGLPAIKKAGSESFLDHAAKLQAQEPLVLAGSPKPLIRSGVVCLTDPARTHGCLAVLRVTAPLSGQ